MSRKHPRKWKTQSNLLYIAGMGLILYAIFIQHDPIGGIPSEVWGIIQYFIIVGTFYGFMYKIERDMRHEFDDKLNTLKDDLNKRIRELKSDFQREIDKIERKL